MTSKMGTPIIDSSCSTLEMGNIVSDRLHGTSRKTQTSIMLEQDSGRSCMASRMDFTFLDAISNASVMGGVIFNALRKASGIVKN